MKEYLYQVEHSWQKQRQSISEQKRRRRRTRIRQPHIARDAMDKNSWIETTSESGISDLETSMHDVRCQCCPYGYHLEMDFLQYLDDMYGPNVSRTLQQIEQRRHDVRRRLTEESSLHRSSSSVNNEIIRETILELDRIVESDIKDLKNEFQRQEKQNRSHSVDSRCHHHQFRAPPLPPRRPSSSSMRTGEQRCIHQHRLEREETIKTRTRSVPRFDRITTEQFREPLRKIDMNQGGPLTVLHNIPPPEPFSRSSSSSSLSTETTLRVSSPEPEERPKEPSKPLYITEILLPPKAPAEKKEAVVKSTVITITDKSQIERRNREIERLENERRTLLAEKEVLLEEIERYKHQPKIQPTTIEIREGNERLTNSFRHEISVQHSNNVDDDDIPPPLPPKQRDVAINHRTEYDDDEHQQLTIVRQKLEEIKRVYTERIHFLEQRIYEQEKDLDLLTQPKAKRHVNTQCQPTVQDRALVTDLIRSVRDVALTCSLQATLPDSIICRDVNLQCNSEDVLLRRDVCMEAIPEMPVQRDVGIGVSLDAMPDRHFRDVGTHVNFDYRSEIHQRDVATMFRPDAMERASNTKLIQTRNFATSVNTIEPIKSAPKPATRPIATDTSTLITLKETACGSNHYFQAQEVATDTISLVSFDDRASGSDIPAELLSRHVATDTRTLISTRENFSSAVSLPSIDVETQSAAIVHHDVASNTTIIGEGRNMSVQVTEERVPLSHSSTSTEMEIFHRLGQFRHSLSNTDIRRSTDRSTFTDRQHYRELAVNTEPKIMYSKDVGDFDVRYQFNRQKSSERSLQTDLANTKRPLGYINEDLVEEQRQDLFKFRMPIEQRTTEEIYETTVTTETKEKCQETEELQRNTSLDNLIEESYEVVSTLVKPETEHPSTRSSRVADLSMSTSQGVNRQQHSLDRTTLIRTSADHRSNVRIDGHVGGEKSFLQFPVESRRDGQSPWSASSSGVRTFTSSSNPLKELESEEMCDVTFSSYDESGLKWLRYDRDEQFDFDEEIYRACLIVNQSLYDIYIDPNEVDISLQLIENYWFRICTRKEIDKCQVENFIQMVTENFSNFLLERIINSQDSDGNTALHYLVMNGHWHLVDCILKTNTCDVCIQNKAGYTAVMRAAMIHFDDKYQQQIVHRLYQNSGNVNLTTNETHQTALMLAVKYGKADLVELLLINGASVNVQDTDGLTALMMAVENGSLTIVKLLLSRSECDVKIANKNGQTALSIAEKKNNQTILDKLRRKLQGFSSIIEHDHRPSEKDKSGTTATFYV